MDETSKKALELHKKYQGKIAVYCKMPVNPPDDLTLAYTPGLPRSAQRPTDRLWFLLLEDYQTLVKQISAMEAL